MVSGRGYDRGGRSVVVGSMHRLGRLLILAYITCLQLVIALLRR